MLIDTFRLVLEEVFAKPCPKIFSGARVLQEKIVGDYTTIL